MSLNTKKIATFAFIFSCINLFYVMFAAAQCKDEESYEIVEASLRKWDSSKEKFKSEVIQDDSVLGKFTNNDNDLKKNSSVCKGDRIHIYKDFHLKCRLKSGGKEFTIKKGPTTFTFGKKLIHQNEGKVEYYILRPRELIIRLKSIILIVKGTNIEANILRNKIDITVKGEISVISDNAIRVEGIKIASLKNAYIVSANDDPYSFSYLPEPEKILEFATREEAVEHFENQLGTVKSDTRAASLKNNIGRIYFEFAEYEKAMKIFKEISDNLDKDMAELENRIWVGIVQNNLGAVFYSIGEYDNAVQHYIKASGVEEDIFGRESSVTAITYNNLSLAYRGKGNTEESLRYIRDALEVDEKVSGRSPSKISTRFNSRGFVFYDKKEYNRALLDFEKALNVNLGTIGENHQNTAIAYNNLGSVWRKRGGYKKAIDYYRSALDINLNIFRNDKHPHIAVNYNNLGLALRDNGEYHKAINCFHNALTVLGESSPDRAISLNGLGSAYQGMGEYEKAIEKYQKALEISSNSSGRKYLDTKLIEENIEKLKKNMER